MNLKDMLKNDFDLDLNISGGRGQSKEDPVVVLDSNLVEASFTEMQILRALGKGRSIFWRTLTRTPLEHDQKILEKITIETKEETTSKIIIQKESYYFDLSALELSENLSKNVIVFRDIQIAFPYELGWLHYNSSTDYEPQIAFPYELGWLHYNSSTDYEPHTPGLGKALAYGAPGIKATIYVYDKSHNDIPSNIDSQIVSNELEFAVSDFLKHNPIVMRHDELFQSKEFLLKTFSVGEDLSVVGLTAFRGKFIKLRITLNRVPILIDIVQQSIGAIQDSILIQKLERTEDNGSEWQNGNTSHPEWMLVNEFGDNSTYVDRTSLQRNGSLIMVTVRYVLNPPGTDERNGKPVKVMLMLEEYDTNASRFRIHRIIFTYADGTTGEPLLTEPTWCSATAGNLKTLLFLRTLGITEMEKHKTK